MRLVIHAEVYVDVEAWREEYGTAGDARDVEDYLLNQWAGSPAAEAGGLAVDGFAGREEVVRAE